MKVKVPYVISKTKADGTVTYYYNPPRAAVKAGIVSPRPLGTDLEKQVIPEAKRLNLILEGWRTETVGTPEVSAGKSLRALVTEYATSEYFRTLDKDVQAQYMRALDRLCDAKLKDSNKTLGDMPPSWIRRRHADQLHAHIKAEHGEHPAYLFVAACRRLFNIGIKWDRVDRNPFEKMEIKKPKSRTKRWTYDQIETFANKAVELGHTSVAIIALLAFELGQRLGDVRRYMWNQYEDGYLRYTQHKSSPCFCAPEKRPGSPGKPRTLGQ
jgi:integrase